MIINQYLKCWTAGLCALAMILGVISPLHASMIGTASLLHAEQSQAERERLLDTLTRDDVGEKLSSMGVSMEQAAERVARMTDEEVRHLNERIGDLPAGADALGAVLLILVIFVVTDVIGITNIFPFVRPMR